MHMAKVIPGETFMKATVVGFVPITGKPVFRPKLSAENPAGNVTGKLKFPAEIFSMKFK